MSTRKPDSSYGWRLSHPRRRERRPFASTQIECRHERESFRAPLLAHALGRHAELLAECSSECFVRPITDVQRHRENVRRALCECLRGPREPSRAQISHDRPTGRSAEGIGEMRARYAGRFRYRRQVELA